MAFSSCLKTILLLPVLTGVVFAGAGANGGQGYDPVIFSYDLVFGTISPSSGSPVNFLATTVNVDTFLADFSNGGDSGTPPTVNSIVDTGVAGLLALSASTPLQFVLTPTGGGSPLNISDPFANQLTDNIWFSNGTAGQINPSDISNSSAILSAAQTLGALSGSDSFASSQSGEGSVSFTNSTTLLDPSVSFVLGANINLEELDLSAPVASTPEPSMLWFGLLVFAAIIGSRLYYRRVPRS